jgi:Holliday junction resolvase-like predicted endonuclease/predicted transcriptional regulator
MMVIERELLVSLLKLTKNGSILIESVNKDAKIALDIVRKLLEKLQNEGLVYLKDDSVETNRDNRLRIAVKAVSLGADIERVSGFFSWQEFEDIAALALERNGYVVAKNMRFKHAGRRWEIDVVGCRKPLVLCVDCKHWQHGVKPSALRKIVEAQVKRARALADTLPNTKWKVECVKWNKAKFVPVILSLIPSRSKFYENVPVVPVLQLQDFLIQLPAQVESLTYFVKEFSHL